MMVLLGEVGGVEEYDVCNAIKAGRITKPLVAWCIGTCACKYVLRSTLLNNNTYTDVPRACYLSYTIAFATVRLDRITLSLQ